MKTIIKEVFIMCLLCVSITLVLGILFYEYMPQQRSFPKEIKYEPNKNIAEQIEEIDLASNNTSIIKSYSMGQSDLEMYKSQNMYVSGKKDPFSEYKEEEDNTTTSTTETKTKASNSSSTSKSSESNSTGSNSSSSSDENSSSGKFFEKPGVK